MTKALALALSFPATLLGIAWGIFELIDRGFISTWVGFAIFSLIIFNTIYLLIYYAKNTKPP